MYWDNVVCPRCGNYSIGGKDNLKMALDLDEHGIRTYAKDMSSNPYNPLQELCVASAKCAYSSKTKTNTSECRAVLSHVLSKAPINRILTLQDFTNILTHNILPSPAEQADNLIKHLGDRLSGLGDAYAIRKDSDELKNLGARIGSKVGAEWKDFYVLVVALEMQGLIAVAWEANATAGGKKIFSSISLTLSGWDRFEEMKRVTNSKSAFVAMKFKGDDGANYFFQDELLSTYLIDAVKQTGFVLSNPLSDNPQAGNLHARLELEMRKARFVVVELSHHNNGAY